jgi:hypothetical protein
LRPGVAVETQHAQLQPVEQRRECGLLAWRRGLTQLAPDWQAAH